MSYNDQTNAIMHSIYLNASNNIDNNYEYIDDEDDAIEFCQEYLNDYASLISENIRDIEDKRELLEALEEDIIESAWVHKVMLAYRDEVKRHIEAEANEVIQELIHEAPKPRADIKPIYKLIKDNNVPSN